MKREIAGVMSAVLWEHGQGTPTRLEEGREREGLFRFTASQPREAREA